MLIIYVLMATMRLASAAPLGCYSADNIWMDYPQRVPGSDRGAHWMITALNEDVWAQTLRMIKVRPAIDLVICFEGTYGTQHSLVAWSARIRPRSEVRRVSKPGVGEVWVDFTEDTAGWGNPYSDWQSSLHR